LKVPGRAVGAWLLRGWRAVGWCGVLAVIVLSLIPDAPSLTEYPQEDKLQHILAYFTLMLWFAQIHLERRARLRIALALCAMGVAIEFAQGGTGWRTFSFADMAADAVGVALGWLAAPPRGPDLLAHVARVLSRGAAR
jgi:VanZ family protein